MDPLAFYKNERNHYKKLLTAVQKELIWLSWIRFSAFLITVFFVYYFFGNTQEMLLTTIFGGAIFSFFLKRYWKKKEEKQAYISFVDINELEIAVQKGDVSKLETGEELKDATHAFSYDIDLFGIGSFFQLVNRTVTSAGKQKLVSLLSANDIEHIKKKQKSITELAGIPKWRQQFSALAGSVETEVKPDEILHWMKKHKTSIPKCYRWLPRLFAVVSLCLIIWISFFNLPFSILTIWFFIGIGFSVRYLKNVNDLYHKATKAKATFQQYYKLLEVLEETKFSSEALKHQHDKICVNAKKSSELMKEFFEYLNALDQRNNVIFAIFGNGLLLWDIKQASRIENWMSNYKDQVEDWFEVISFFDSQNSLANYVFNHPTYKFPVIVEEGAVIDANNLGHPLLSSIKRITSNCKMQGDSFFIVTGANMAGKSTFLRTISLNIMMSNVGLPVCAQQMKYKPIKLITSIRNSDSLSENTSYFFSELKRLKFIVDSLKRESYFIVLDEILKGTNSMDKAQGSQKFVEKLVNSNATGVIATHDLSLCEIAEEYPQIENYYFDAEIKNDELFFDYKLKKGVCQNMNASFLLRKMEII
ncbi:DNA mismatch repair protein MutS [Flavicella sp.]|uniref:MutS-related protein n=1 Tax=Flavicella sp. TaxID=2957742 RepID=UPI00301A6141